MQVVFGGDPEAALIQYTKNEEARRAISCIEAVLNNRFICVYWHRELGINSTGPRQHEQSSGNQAAGSAPSPGLQHISLHKVSTEMWSTSFTNLHLIHVKSFSSFVIICREPSHTIQLRMC